MRRAERARINNRWLRHSLWLLSALLLCVLPLSCASSSAPRTARLEAPRANTTLGPGDVFQLQIVGENELPSEFQVASDGTVDLPYLKTIKAEGLEPHELARLVRQRLIEDKILLDPSVVIRVTEYRSKQLTVLGQVRSPGKFAFQPGMTLIQAISVAGGLNSIAVRDAIRLTRQLEAGGSRTVVIDLDAINAGEAEDVQLQPGDRIYVPERVF